MIPCILQYLAVLELGAHHKHGTTSLVPAVDVQFARLGLVFHLGKKKKKKKEMSWKKKKCNRNLVDKKDQSLDMSRSGAIW